MKFHGHTHNTASSLYAGNGKVQCVYCNGEHYLASCERVRGLKERRELLLRSGHCFNCLNTNPRTAQAKEIAVIVTNAITNQYVKHICQAPLPCKNQLKQLPTCQTPLHHKISHLPLALPIMQREVYCVASNCTSYSQ